MALKKRRAFEVFTLSFLDCICCGFGAVVLFYTIVQAQAGAQEIMHVDQLTGEVSKLEEEVLVGEKNLVLLRNTLEKTDDDAATAKSRALRIAEELKKRKAVRSTRVRRATASSPSVAAAIAATSARYASTASASWCCSTPRPA